MDQDLRSLQRLYGLLLNEQPTVEEPGLESLDTDARRVLINLLDDASSKAFDSREKIRGTQSRTSYSPWSGQQNPEPLSLTNAPTNVAVPSQVQIINGEETFNDPTDQLYFSGQLNSVSPGEYNVRLKRCRVCQKPKVKQLTKEISFRDGNGLNLNYISENPSHIRRWEVGNDPNVVGDSGWPSNSQTVQPLILTNLSDEEEKIAAEASTKIHQIESRISNFQVTPKHTNPFEDDLETLQSPNRIFPVGRNDPNSGTTSRTNWNSQRIEELTMERQPVYKMLPSSQRRSQETGNGMYDQRKNQYDYRLADETPRSYEELTRQSQPVYKMLPSSQRTSQENRFEVFDQRKNQYDHRWDDVAPRSYEELNRQSQPVLKRLPRSQTMSRETGYERFDQMKNRYDHQWDAEAPRSYEDLTRQSQPVYKMLPRSQTMRHITRNERFDQNINQRDHQWYDQTSRPIEDLTRLRISQVIENEMRNPINFQRDHRWNEETPRLQGQQVNPMLLRNQTMNQKAGFDMFDYRRNQQDYMPGETYNRLQSAGVSSNVTTITDKNRFLDRNMSIQINREPLHQMQKTQLSIPSVDGRYNKELQESEVITRKKPGMAYKEKDEENHYKGEQEPDEPKRVAPRESQWLSDSPISSSTHSSSRSSQNESESESKSEDESESESESVSQGESQSESGSGSESQTDSTNLSDSEESKSESEKGSVSSQDQSDKSGSDKSGSNSSKSEKDEKQVGGLKKLKNKFSVIFHHHHHHHHHDDDEEDHKKPLWKRAGKVIGHTTKQVEAYGEKAAHDIQKKAVYNMQTYGEKAVHNIQKKAVPKIQAYGEKAVHNIQKKAVPKLQAYGEKAVHNIQKKAVPKIQAYGEKAVHNIQKKAVPKIQAYGEKAVHNIQKKAVPKIQAYGEKAVHNIQKKAVPKIQAYGEKAVKNIQKTAVKNIQKNALVLKEGQKKLVGGIIKQTKNLKKPNKSTSKELATTNPSSGKKVGKKMSWFQMLRTQRKIKRIEKLRDKVNK